MGKYYEELNVGDRFVTPAKTVTEAAATVMIGLGGYTHAMFNDEEYCKAHTPFHTRIVPGEMVLFFMGGLAEQTGIYDDTVIALVGLDNVRFRTPVQPGDTIRLEMEIIRKRETSKPDRGLVTHAWVCRNQRQEAVMEAEATLLFKRRPG